MNIIGYNNISWRPHDPHPKSGGRNPRINVYGLMLSQLYFILPFLLQVENCARNHVTKCPFISFRIFHGAELNVVWSCSGSLHGDCLGEAHS